MTSYPESVNTNARVKVSVGGTEKGKRRAINFTSTDNSVTITGTDDGTNEKVTVDLATAGAAPTGTAGGALSGTYPNPDLASTVAGAGLGITGDVLAVNVDGTTIEINADTLRVKAGGIGANEIASTAVTPGGYGDATHVATFTVDGDGRLTAAASVAITAGGFARLLFSHHNNSSNTGTGETDLYSDTLAAGQLAKDGDVIEYVVSGTYAGHATALERLRFYFGGSAFLDTGALAVTTSSSWSLKAVLTRHSFAVVVTDAVLFSNGTPAVLYQSVSNIGSLNLSNTQVIKVTGTASGTGAASSQVQANAAFVRYSPA